MLKSNHFRKVEELIRFRKQLRGLAALLESIGDTVQLWRKTEKIDEYWDHFGCHKEGEIKLCVANLKASLELANKLVSYLQASYLTPFVVNPANVESFKDHSRAKSLMARVPVKHQLLALQKMTLSLAPLIGENFDENWDQWKRKDSRITAEFVHALSREFLMLEAEIEDNWSFISQMPTHEETEEQKGINID